MCSSANQLHLQTIISELEASLDASELSGFSTVTSSDPALVEKTCVLEERIFEIANEVALSTKAKAPRYSNFHSWEYFRDKTTAQQVQDAAPSFPKDIQPFGDCVTTAYLDAVALQEALSIDGDADLIPYASLAVCDKLLESSHR
jgi:hypothetical protein